MVGLWRPAAGLGAPSIALLAWDLLKEVQGAGAKEGQEELLCIQDQEGQPWGETPRPR